MTVVIGKLDQSVYWHIDFFRGEYCVNLSLIDFSRQNKKKIPQEKETDLSAKKPTMRTQPTIVEGTKVLWPFGSTKRNTERHMVSKTNKAKEKQGESEENALVTGVPVAMTDDNHIVSVVDEEQKSQNEVERENEVGEPCAVDSQLKKSKNKLTDDQIVHPVQHMIVCVVIVIILTYISYVMSYEAEVTLFEMHVNHTYRVRENYVEEL